MRQNTSEASGTGMPSEVRSRTGLTDAETPKETADVWCQKFLPPFLRMNARQGHSKLSGDRGGKDGENEIGQREEERTDRKYEVKEIQKTPKGKGDDSVFMNR